MQVDSKPEELDSIDREVVRLKIEQEALKKESDAGSKARLKNLEKELTALEKQSADLTARWQAEKSKLSDAQKLKTELEQARTELANAQRRGEFQKAGELAYGQNPRAGEEAQRDRGERRQGRDGRGGGHRRSRRAGRLALDRRAGRPHARRREGKAAAHGGGAFQARDRPGRSRAGGLDCGAPRARRLAGPASADRLVHVPRADRRRQDRAHQGARRIPVRRRDRADPHRHVGVHGEALGRAADRRASRLRRLRGGRRAHRSGAAAALSGDPVRRDREGAPGRVQRAAAGARRRAADRRAGPHGRLPQHADRDDLEPRFAVPRRPAGRRRYRGGARACDGGGAFGVPAGVPEPRRRDHPVPSPQARADEPHRRHPVQAALEAAGGSQDRDQARSGGTRLARRQGLRPGLWGASA